MKELTMSEIKAISLEILDNIHMFCVNNNIKYSLGFGSLIGAVRHKGFIPWDDDIDIVMQREDFDKFCKLYKDSSEYKLFCPQRANIYSACARLCEMKKTFVKTESPMFTEPTGVWIDILPLDTIPQNLKERSNFKEMIKKAHHDVMRRRWSMKKSSSLKALFFKFCLRLLCPRSISYYVNRHNQLSRRYNGKDSDIMALLAFPVYLDWDNSPKSVFSETIMMSFEGKNYCVMAGYDEWLRIIYGDYMKLPPVEKQVQTHSCHRYYWND